MFYIDFLNVFIYFWTKKSWINKTMVCRTSHSILNLIIGQDGSNWHLLYRFISPPLTYCHKGFHSIVYWIEEGINGALSGLRQFLGTESTLKIMENVFYFTLKALKAEKRLIWKDKVNYKICNNTYCPISQKVSAIRQWNFVSY